MRCNVSDHLGFVDFVNAPLLSKILTFEPIAMNFALSIFCFFFLLSDSTLEGVVFNVVCSVEAKHQPTFLCYMQPNGVALHFSRHKN